MRRRRPWTRAPPAPPCLSSRRCSRAALRRAQPRPARTLPRCGTWGTGRRGGAAARVRPPRRSDPSLQRAAAATSATSGSRGLPSGIGEVDRVLGGGWVPGAAVLLAGEPGIGKSTLLLQLADAAARAGRRAVVVCGEESPGQVKLRAQRLGVDGGRRVAAQHRRPRDRRLPRRRGAVAGDRRLDPDAHGRGRRGAPGRFTQVRDATALLTQAAKSSGTVLVLIGHVTKQGEIAGPKVVEHVVDVTLALESAAGLRVLRGIKNRFGPAGEVGVFEMTDGGLRPVGNPSDAFLAERPVGVPGSVVVAALEGQRPLLVEVQALASRSPFADAAAGGAGARPAPRRPRAGRARAAARAPFGRPRRVRQRGRRPAAHRPGRRPGRRRRGRVGGDQPAGPARTPRSSARSGWPASCGRWPRARVAPPRPPARATPTWSARAAAARPPPGTPWPTWPRPSPRCGDGREPRRSPGSTATLRGRRRATPRWSRFAESSPPALALALGGLAGGMTVGGGAARARLAGRPEQSESTSPSSACCVGLLTGVRIGVRWGLARSARAYRRVTELAPRERPRRRRPAPRWACS
jgi:DNA repair protein RadA/Sms